MKLRLCTLFVVFVVTDGPVFAQFVEYGDATREQWFSDAGDVTTIGFDEFPDSTLTLTDEYSDLGVTFTGLNFVSGPSGSFPDAWGLRIFNFNDIYFSEPMNWVAADFLGSIRLDIYSGDTFLHSFQRPLPEHFVGGISDIPFDRVRIYSPVSDVAAIDNLYFGPSIPAPPAVAPLMFLFLLAKRRRR